MQPMNCKLAVCPHCGAKKELIQLMSGNTCGLEQWSDVKQIAPMLPQPSPVQKCPHCNHYYFLNKVKIKQGNSYSFEKGWLSFEDSVEAFKELNNNELDNLGLLTIIVTWAFNDIVRGGGVVTDEQYQEFKGIISQSLNSPIFTENELLRGELYREIGEYDECIRILSEYKPDNEFLENVKGEIIAKAQNHNNQVFKLNHK